jgi:hypothetical protein
MSPAAKRALLLLAVAAALLAVALLPSADARASGPLVWLPSGIAMLLALLAAIAALVAGRANARARRLPHGEPATSLLLPDAWYRLRPDGTFVAAAAPTGHPAPIGTAGLIGRRIQDVTPPPVGADLLRELQAARRAGATRCVEFSPAGCDAEVRFVPLPDGDVLAFARDLTARRRAERQLAWQVRILELIASSQRRQEVFAALVEGIEQLLPDCRCSILLRNGERLHIGWAPSLPADFNAMVEGLEIGPDRGACGAAAWANRTVVSSDIATDPQWASAHAIVRQFGIGDFW